MFCDPIDIPDELISAQEAGRLVVFAGAGVSMGAPSSLPSFEELAQDIARNTGAEVAPPYDEFLGMLADERGVKVHEDCRNILSRRDSSPAPLHGLLLRLFRTADAVRLVTTNFDRHFSMAAQALGWPLPEYRAPALPLGDDFTGIVHLHGSLADESRRMVLTDADFGRAYLIEGWATGFLRAVFEEWTVLFVGYSHDDPPMRYLARGLSRRRGGGRYALVGSDNEERKWRALGIVPVPYPLHRGSDEHVALTQGVGRWVEIIEMQALELEDRVRKIVTAPEAGAPSRSDTDLLRRALGSPETARYFTRHATGWHWVKWLHEQGLMEPCMTVGMEAAEMATLADWLGRQLARDETGEGLWLVNACGGRLDGHVGYALGNALCDEEQDIDLSNPTTRAWIVLLAQSDGQW